MASDKDWNHLLTKKIDLSKSREWMMRDRRNKFYQELVLYLCFVVVFIRQLLGQTGDIYDQAQALNGLVCNAAAPAGAIGDGDANLAELCSFREIDDIWNFVHHLEGLLCPVVSQIESDSSIPIASSYHQLESNPRFFRVGPMKLRQLRVAPTNCSVGPGFGRFVGRGQAEGLECYPPFSSATEMRSSWTGTMSARQYNWTTKHSVLYPISPSAHISSYSYGDGGYSALLCESRRNQGGGRTSNESCAAGREGPECASGPGGSGRTTSRELQQDGWLDLSTRALAIDFVLFNPSSGVWSLASHVFEISAAGSVIHDESGSTIYVREHSIFTLGALQGKVFLEFLMMLSVVAYVTVDVLSTFVMGRALGFGFFFGMDSWHTFEALLNVLTVGLFSVCFLLELYKENLCAWSEGDFDFLPIHRLRDLKLLTDDWSACVAFLLLAKFFKYMRVDAGLNLLFTLLSDAKSDLLRFLVMFGLIFFSFIFMGTIAFGGQLSGFNTLINSFSTCFQMLAGDFDHDALMKTNSQMATFFFSSFVVLVFLILVNVFVAIISEHFPKQEERDGDDTSTDLASLSRRQQLLVIRSKLEFLRRQHNRSYAFYTKHMGTDVTYDVIKNARESMSKVLPTVIIKREDFCSNCRRRTCDLHRSGEKGLNLQLGQILEFVSTSVKDQEARQLQSRLNWRKAVHLVRGLLKMRMKKTVANSTEKNVAKSGSTTISLSENFDHDSLRHMLEPKDLVYLDSEHLSEYRICLSVIDHAKNSTLCRVVGVGTDSKFARWNANDDDSKRKPAAIESSLQGGETLTISHSSLVPFLLRYRVAPLVLGYIKFWKWHKYGLSAAFMKKYTKGDSTKDKARNLLSDFDVWCILEESFLQHQLAHVDKALKKEGSEGNDDDEKVVILPMVGLRFDELRNAIDQYAQKHRGKFAAAADPTTISKETARVMSKFSSCLYSMSHREREGYDYVPSIIGGSTSGFVAGELRRLAPLIEVIAANAHEEWALTRIKQGWKWGEKNDAAEKMHPELMPYDRLNAKCQEYDKKSAQEALAAIMSFKYALL
jgi:hypothetical protein